MPHPARLLGALCLAVAGGCAATPYQYGHFQRSHSDHEAPCVVVIEHGTPNKRLDRLAWLVGTPERILTLNKKVNQHELSPETTEKLKTYLERNDLTDVYVYVNHYDPAGQWRRLRENTQMSPVWRYSFGVFSFIGYTVWPRRVFGGDQYNPYTNSLYLNSDVPAVALHEAAFAKDVHARKLPGTYAAINDLPLLSLWHETRAVSDVLGYARAQNDLETEQETYKVQYPRMGADGSMVGGPFVPFWWGGVALRVGGAAVGHVAGRTLAAQRTAQVQVASPAPGATESSQQAENDNRAAPKGPVTLAERSDAVRARHAAREIVGDPAVGPVSALERLPKP